MNPKDDIQNIMKMTTQNWLYCVLTFLIILWWLYMKRAFNYWKKMGVPFIQPIPIFGNILDIFLMRTSLGHLCKKLHSEHQVPYLGMFVLNEPALLIRHLPLIKTILVRDFNHFMDRSIADNPRDDPVSSSFLLMVKHPLWQDLRKLINPLFSSRKLKLMHRYIINSATNWDNYTDELTKIDNIVEIRDLSSKFTVDSIVATAFGVKSDCYTNKYAPFWILSQCTFKWQTFWSGLKSTSYYLAPRLVEVFRLRFMDKQTIDFLSSVFLGEMENRKKSNLKRDDLIDILLDHMETGNGFQLNQHQLVAQAGFLFMAGYETSSSTISYALYELAKRPDIQGRVREEILETREKYDGFTYESLGDMSYLDMIMKETLRKYPVLPFLDRRCIEDYKLPGTEIVLKKGVAVYIFIFGIHYDPEYYPDPERFEPLRFSPENVKNRPPFTFLPFGEGPRSCAGKRYGEMSVKTGLAYILSRYEVKMCAKTQSEMKFSPFGFLLQPDNGKIFLEFVKL